MPIIESTQFGIAIGLSLQGYTVLNLYPRMNFMLSAIDPLINFLDKIEEISHKEYSSKMIIRTAIGSQKPLFPGHQHIFDYTEGIKSMCHNIQVVKLQEPQEIFPAYYNAYFSKKPTLIVEYADYYTSK